jgi:hypothetical protein
MDGSVAQGLQDRKDRLGVVVVGADVVEAGVHEHACAEGKHAENDGDGDAVMLDVLFHDVSP